ncbi:MAG: hypothetical protein HQ510_02280 [Candidatus Marinimicrobia bacterium]|nr:hypothetical protein [Candidatus Neomarinimicrobiota bacterium]
MNLAGFEPGIIGIIIYMIYSAYSAQKKKQEKLQKRGTVKSPPSSGKDVFDLFNTLKSEFNKAIEPETVVNQTVKIKESDSFDLSEKESSEQTYSEFEREQQADYAAASIQSYEYSDFNHSESVELEPEIYQPFKHNASLRHVMKMSPLKQAIVLKEILDQPIGFRREGGPFW